MMRAPVVQTCKSLATNAGAAAEDGGMGARAGAARAVLSTKMTMPVLKGPTMTATRRMVQVILSTMVYAQRNLNGTAARRGELTMMVTMTRTIRSILVDRRPSNMAIVTVQVDESASVQGTSAALVVAGRSEGHRRVQMMEATTPRSGSTEVAGHSRIATTLVLDHSWGGLRGRANSAMAVVVVVPLVDAVGGSIDRVPRSERIRIGVKKAWRHGQRDSIDGEGEDDGGDFGGDVESVWCAG